MKAEYLASSLARDPYATNLFLALGKYVERQDENLFTQSLVLLFNRVEPFRRAFVEHLTGRSPGRALNHEGLVAHSQVGRRLSDRRMLVDMEIWREGTNAPLFLVESKLDARLGTSQVKNYKAALKKLKKSTRLVLLTKHGIDEAIWRYAPRGTIWLSWPLVTEIATQSSRRASRLDQLLIRDFLHMTRLKGITTVRPMTADSLSRLSMLSRFAFSEYPWLSHKTIEAVDLAFQRLRDHRDGAWESLFANSHKWTSYQSAYKWDEKRRTVLQVGFYRLRPRRNIQESYIALELSCGTKPRLSIGWGWKLSPSHSRYKRDDSMEWEEQEYSVPETRKLFNMPMPQAIKHLERNLIKIGKAFLRSRYAG